MSDEATARLGLPMLQPGQAQKEMSHNEALVRLDLAIDGAVLGVGIETPPAAPEPGQAWILGAAPDGAWTGQAHAMAGWTTGGWRFVGPVEGMRAWIVPEGVEARYSAGSWTVGEVRGRLIVDGVQLVGSRGAAVADPEGGATVDAEARAAVVSILERLRAHGLIDTV